ncbi:gliding motility lipoprotein GldH [Williamwhitmania taraxaci]|uniref:Gliding motility-associated lipoprotein GldH n=1 Tax=Williamwhitmania taraxaci TaxID=1640674 RepID=A0A1G6MXB6_9BACT|nr:gliding motility lipoprotein GldH [Williamwhitmania taraxaci]SDC60248.1 gliding motility-associated lipoprotein GldH [Williamwhitmania taraxaci]
MTTGSQTTSLQLFFAICFSLTLFACDRNMVYEKIEDVPGSEWNATAPIDFVVPVDDTLTVQNILITIRNSSSYKYSNLFLFVTTTSPSGASVCDTVEVPMADDKGRWYGKGFSHSYDSRMPYKLMIKFPLKGDYKISLLQGMREETLSGIEKVGIRVEQSKIK